MVSLSIHSGGVLISPQCASSRSGLTQANSTPSGLFRTGSCNDLVGRDAMRKVRGLLKKDHHLDATYLFGEGKGSVADLPIKDLLALIRVKLSNPWYVTPSPAVVGETGPGDEL